jgi:hypothetical protein
VLIDTAPLFFIADVPTSRIVSCWLELKFPSPIESQASTVAPMDFDQIGGGRPRSEGAATGTVTFPDGLLHETIAATSRD